MRRSLISLALVAAVGPAGLRSQAPAVERATAPLVIDAVAFDRNGMPVMDLKREELEVWIAGYRVPIDTLTAVTASDERAGRSIVLVLDDVTLDPVMAARVKEVARRFVNRMLPGDEMSIVTFDGRARLREHQRFRRRGRSDHAGGRELLHSRSCRSSGAPPGRPARARRARPPEGRHRPRPESHPRDGRDSAARIVAALRL